VISPRRNAFWLSEYSSQFRGNQLRKNTLFGFVFAVALCGSSASIGQDNTQFQHNGPLQWETLSQNEQLLVDRLAADFYESDLRLTQSRQIEASTATNYSSMSAEERAEFRENRRDTWQNMQDEERATLRNVKLPSYSNLTDEQKAAFRKIAIDRLAPQSMSRATDQSNGGAGNDI